jgi:hypothetical protein
VAFDAELYLRLAGERALLGSGGAGVAPNMPSIAWSWWHDGIHAAADALCAVGAIERDLAQQVLHEYSFAVALREEGHAQYFLMRDAYHPDPWHSARPLSERRLVPCDARIMLGQYEVHVRFVSLADDSTSVGATLPMRSWPRKHRRAFLRGRGGPRQITMTDDRGTASTAHFSGGGSYTEWEGRFAIATSPFSTDQPLAPDTAWVEIESERVELVDRPLNVEVRVEPLQETNDALQHLWHSVASADPFRRTEEKVGAAIDTLVVAGCIDADDPRLKDVRAVAAGVQEGAQPSQRRDLPEPWKSLFARGRRANGRVGRIAVGGVTPEFDGFSVALMCIDSAGEGFSAWVEVPGGGGGFAPFEAEVGRGRLAWWAADDRGNRYFGQTGTWSGSYGHGEGRIEFRPALDPEATRLSVMPTTEKSRCVIEFPLSWESA